VDRALPPELSNGEQHSVYENFSRIPADEQQRILRVCLEEFALHRYESASTNAIVRRAQIPKGTLFYYFGSKKDLYLYLIDYAVRSYTAEFAALGDELPSDLFERLLYIGEHRMRYAVRQPMIYRFFYNALIYTPDEIRPEMESRYAEYATTSAKLMQAGLDQSKFKAGVIVEQALELTYLVLEGIYNRYAAELQRMEPEEALKLVDQIMEECRQYFGMLMHGLYKTSPAKDTVA
jgi:TetR/AcrR family transcriptional regulator